jgi:hypothetical protein
MKKLTVFFITFFLFIPICIFSQARVNAELPVIIDTGRELNRIVGWSLSPEGQWVSRSNRIPVILEASVSSIIDINSYRLGIDNITRLKLYNVNYNNVEYFLLEKIINDGQYEYPNIRRGWYNYSRHFFYIIEKKYFQTTLVKDKKYTNTIPIYNYTNVTRIDVLPNIIEPLVRDRTSNDANNSFYRIEKLENITIFTFYYYEDKIVRFFLNHGFPSHNNYHRKTLTELSEDYYFECSFEHFVNFFNSVIEEP